MRLSMLSPGEPGHMWNVRLRLPSSPWGARVETGTRGNENKSIGPS